MTVIEPLEEAFHGRCLRLHASGWDVRHRATPDGVASETLQDQFHTRCRDGVVVDDHGVLHADDVQDQGGENSCPILARGQ